MRRIEQRTSRRRAVVRATVVGALAAAAVFGMAEWLAFRSIASANHELRARLELLRLENERTEQMIARYDEFEREAEVAEAEFAAALAAVPTEAELAGALDDLERVTEASGVSLVRFTPGARPAPLTPGPTPASDAPPLQSRPISVSVRSGFREVRSLLERLAAYPRLLTVESFSMRSSNRGPYTLEASLGMSCYFKRPPAEATPPAK
jgi:Tfp pilus assembly protein PilO